MRGGVEGRCRCGRVDKDVLLSIPDESIVPYSLESMVSAICVAGTYEGNNKFKLTVCVTVILKVLAQVEILIPSYGFCPIPPCEEFAENVCDEFFSLPLFPPPRCATTTTYACATGPATRAATRVAILVAIAAGNRTFPKTSRPWLSPGALLCRKRPAQPASRWAGRIRDPHLYVFLLWFLDGTEQFRRVKGKAQHSRDFSCNFPRLNEKHHVSIRIQIKIGFGAERAGQLLL